MSDHSSSDSSPASGAIARGPRIILRMLRIEDAVTVSEQFDRDAEVTRFTGGVKTYEQTCAGLARIIAGYGEPVRGVLAVESVNTGSLIGWGILKPFLLDPAETEVGYGVSRRWWGQGYGTEIGTTLLAYGFETLGLPRIVAAVHPDNTSSRRVIEKIGLSYQKKVEWPEQGMVDYYSIERSEYQVSKGLGKVADESS